MTCEAVRLPGGGVALVKFAGRRRSRCYACGEPARYQCDHPAGKGKTCDRWLCERHRHPQGRRNVDYCPEHNRQPSLTL